LTGRRVLLVHELVGGFGGAERYLELLGPALGQRGLDASIAVFGARDGREAYSDRLRAAFAGSTVEQGTTTPWALRRIVRSERPHLIHWNLFEPFIFRGGAIAALPWGRPSVVTDHLPMMRNGLHYEVVRRVVNRRFAGMIVVSQSAEREAMEHWRRLPPVAVVRNGVEVGAARVRRPPDQGEPVRLLFVGRLAAQKNPFFALDVLAALRTRGTAARLRFVGDGELGPAIARRATEDVELSGFASDVTPHLLDAHLLLAPGAFEGLPLAPIEALATGLPVLASDIPPHRELARECSALLVLPPDEERWAAEIEGMLPQLERLSAQAVEARQLFSVDRMADETIAAYERFVPS
jgi:glycosyltransferase involved in cell wall biosynthesis